MDVMAATEYVALNLNGKTGIGWVGYIIIGGIAGWLASKFVKGGGSGILMDIVIGVVGAFVAGRPEPLGVVVNMVAIGSPSSWRLVAAVLLWIARLVRRTTSSDRGKRGSCLITESVDQSCVGYPFGVPPINTRRSPSWSCTSFG